MTSLWLDRAESRAFRPETAGVLPRADADVVVAGGGITGLVTGLLAARAGRSVVVLEARHLGAAATGNTTAKLSLLQGSVLSQIRKHNPDKVLRAYLEANRVGQDWLVDYLTNRGVAFQRRDAYSYAVTAQGADTLEQEEAAAVAAGLEVERVPGGADIGLPFGVRAALRLPDQVQFDPVELLHALADDLITAGGAIAEGVRVRGAVAGIPNDVMTTAGDLTAGRLVLATGTPILDRGLYFAKLVAKRSYAFALEYDGPLPDGMYLSVDARARSVRTAPGREGAGDLLLIGGNGHVVGRHPSPAAGLDELLTWTHQAWPGARLTHTWSAQDYQSANHVPFVGELPRGGGNITIATGFNKWGMTNGVAAGLALDALTAERTLDWSRALRRRLPSPRDLAEEATSNATVGVRMVTDWVKVAVEGTPEQEPPEGTGTVGRVGIHPVGVSTVDGETCSVSAVCPHLGGVLAWNDAEKTWDCPLHGSRFAADGTRLEGPTTKDLASRPLPARG